MDQSSCNYGCRYLHPVRVKSRYIPKVYETKDGERLVKLGTGISVPYAKGLFHQWVISAEHTDSGPMMFTQALIEYKHGEMGLVMPENVHFIRGERFPMFGFNGTIAYFDERGEVVGVFPLLGESDHAERCKIAEDNMPGVDWAYYSMHGFDHGCNREGTQWFDFWPGTGKVKKLISTVGDDAPKTDL